MKAISVNCFFIALCLFVGTSLKAQSIDDYNTEQVRQGKLLYDEDFNPIGHISLKNISSKTITTIEVSVYYGRINAPSYVSLKDRIADVKRVIAHVVIRPNDTGTFSINVPKSNELYKPEGFMITKVRYSDGTVCQ